MEVIHKETLSVSITGDRYELVVVIIASSFAEVPLIILFALPPVSLTTAFSSDAIIFLSGG